MSPPSHPEPIIRPLESEADYAACLALQQATWGPGFSEAVPASILRVAQKVGGVAAGAFDARGALLGFVFGITGVREGRIVHWSDLLAVREEARGSGIGRLLKEHQRRDQRDIAAVQARSLEEAAGWRARTRPLFRDAFARGLRVVGFHCPAGDRCRYLLGRVGK